MAFKPNRTQDSSSLCSRYVWTFLVSGMCGNTNESPVNATGVCPREWEGGPNVTAYCRWKALTVVGANESQSITEAQRCSSTQQMSRCLEGGARGKVTALGFTILEPWMSVQMFVPIPPDVELFHGISWTLIWGCRQRKSQGIPKFHGNASNSSQDILQGGPSHRLTLPSLGPCQ